MNLVAAELDTGTTMQITAAMVKELRERTGAGMMECKQALVDETWPPGAVSKMLERAGVRAVPPHAWRV